jgi:hypothetical protein
MTAADRSGTIYIAGPMRGHADHNHPAFHAAEERLRAAGWGTVHNPAVIGEIAFGNDPTVPGAEYIRRDLHVLCLCGAIALLPGWEASVGARCEVVVAITLGLAFVDAETLAEIPAPRRVVIAGGYERAPGAIESLEDVLDEVRAWQERTFPHRTVGSISEHLRREAIELAADPTDDGELADVVMLAAGLAAERGVRLADVVRAKLERNQRRRWGAPDAHGAVEHIREEAVTP